MRFMINKAIVIVISIIITCIPFNICIAEDIYSIRTYNSNDDIIKFDGIEWLSDREIVENNITNILSIIDLDIKNYEEDNYSIAVEINDERKYTIAPHGYTFYMTDIRSKKGIKTNNIGSIAGWGFRNLYILYLKSNIYDNKQHAFYYSLTIDAKLNDTDKYTIYEDIKSKLIAKYSLCDIKETDHNDSVLSQYKELEIKDGNGNKITLIVSTERYQSVAGDILTLEYECVDVSENLYKIKQRQETEELEQNERAKEKLRESTNGL